MAMCVAGVLCRVKIVEWRSFRRFKMVDAPLSVSLVAGGCADARHELAVCCIAGL